MGAVKKIPMRQCVGCGKMKPKKELVRVLKTEDEGIVIDRTGRKNGRGAYLCSSEECLRLAVKNHGFERSFKTKISGEVYQQLKDQMINGSC